MRHGELHSDSMEAYLILERTLCSCDPDAGLCTCGWDKPDTDILFCNHGIYLGTANQLRPCRLCQQSEESGE